MATAKIVQVNKLPKPYGKYGYTERQINNICRKLCIEIETFWKAFGRNTVTFDSMGRCNFYPCDVQTALFKLTKGKIGKNNGWD
jgi:hypothetical protein